MTKSDAHCIRIIREETVITMTSLSSLLRTLLTQHIYRRSWSHTKASIITNHHNHPRLKLVLSDWCASPNLWNHNTTNTAGNDVKSHYLNCALWTLANKLYIQALIQKAVQHYRRRSLMLDTLTYVFTDWVAAITNLNSSELAVLITKLPSSLWHVIKKRTVYSTWKPPAAQSINSSHSHRA